MVAGEYVVDRNTGKMVLRFDKASYMALPQATKDEIKRYFNFSRHQSGWVSKGQADAYMPQQIAKTLGFSKGGEIGERQSFADRMEAKSQRAEERAERYSEYSENAKERGASLQRGIEEHRGDTAFFTQPITPNSGGRAFANYREKLFNRYHKGFEEFKKAEYFKEESERLRGVASQAQLENKRYLDNRIKEGEADVRKLTKIAEGYYSSPEQMAKYPEYAEKLERHTNEALDKLNYFKAAMERLGGVQYNKSNIQPGDRVKIRHGWSIVKSVGPKNINVIIAEGGARGMVGKYSYAEIKEWQQGKPLSTTLPDGYSITENPKEKGGGYEIKRPDGGGIGLKYTKERAVEFANIYESEHHLVKANQPTITYEEGSKHFTGPGTMTEIKAESKPEIKRDEPQSEPIKKLDVPPVFHDDPYYTHEQIKDASQVVNLPEHTGPNKDKRHPIGYAVRSFKMDADKDGEIELVHQTYPIMGRKGEEPEKRPRLSRRFPRISPRVGKLR